MTSTRPLTEPKQLTSPLEGCSFHNGCIDTDQHPQEITIQTQLKRQTLLQDHPAPRVGQQLSGERHLHLEAVATDPVQPGHPPSLPTHPVQGPRPSVSARSTSTHCRWLGVDLHGHGTHQPLEVSRLVLKWQLKTSFPGKRQCRW